MGKPIIVMIEDNPADVELLRIAFDRLNEPYELVTLDDGEEALRFIHNRHSRGAEPEPCVILLDVHLPKYDGLEVLAALKREPKFQHIHVVMLASGDIRPDEHTAIGRLGAMFRQKPRRFAEVLELATDVLELCRKAVAAV